MVLQAMHDVGLIRLYEVGGDRFLEIVNFEREQPGLHKRTTSDYPDPPEDRGGSVNFREVPGNSGKFPESHGDTGKVREIPSEQNLYEPKGTEQKRTEPTPNPTAADAAVSAVPEVLFEIYRAENKRLPQVLEFGPERREKCRKRLARDPRKFVDQFTRAVIKAQDTPFLRGEGDRGWNADFDWLVANDRNVVRVLEGRYDSAVRAGPGGGSGSVWDQFIGGETEEVAS